MNRKMKIATAPRMDSNHWEQSEISWDELVLWMMYPAPGKDKKIAGSYVLGTLRETTKTHKDSDVLCTDLHRSKDAVVSRDALTLDADSPAPDFLARVKALGLKALVHTTGTSTPEAPRYRVIVPLSRPVSPAEYTAEAVAVMEAIDPDSFDDGSKEFERLMFKPAGDHFSFEIHPGPMKEPISIKPEDAPAATTKRNPLELPGIVGAFNRTYADLDRLIDAYDLPYTRAEGERWRLNGTHSTAGVSEISEGLWWSSHTTDPAYGHAQTAFDLMRLHKFGHEDATSPADTKVTDLPSYAAAVTMAEADEEVTKERVAQDFGPMSPLVTLGYDPAATKEVDLALQLADRELEKKFRYSPARGWFSWTGKVWAPCSSESVVLPVSEALRSLAEEWILQGKPGTEVEALKKKLNNSGIQSIISLLKSVLLVDDETLDSHPDLLNVGNGTVDLRTGDLLDHSREHLLTKITPVNYVPGATHSDWTKVLGSLRPDAVEWMQVRLGQAATGHRTPDDVMPILQGGGANGKTTLTGSISDALGEHAVFLSDRVLLSSNGDHPTEMMDLQGARFALLEETPEGHQLNVKRLKSLVGTPKISARRMRADSETFDATHSMFLTTNYSLNVTETDSGTWRRLAVVMFPHRYDVGAETPDPNLRSRMTRERQLEAVLAWLVEGARRWYAADRVMPEAPASVEADTRAWRMEADPILGYVEERLDFSDESSAVMSSEMYDDFLNWLTDRGLSHWAERTFVARFTGHSSVARSAVKRERVRDPKNLSRVVDGDIEPLPKQVRVWTGIRFK